MKNRYKIVTILIFQLTLVGCYNDLFNTFQEKNSLINSTLLLLATPSLTEVAPSDDYQNQQVDSITEYITPEHSIAAVGTTVHLACVPAITNPPYTYNWQLLVRPAASTASLTETTTSITSLLLDSNGYYIIQLTLYRNGLPVGTHYAYVGTPSVVHYVNDNAAAGGNGAGWATAWRSLPATLSRGHTYYIADGTYPGYYCNTPQDGVTPIYIKKAVGADHGSGTGWDTPSMGSGQAVFQTQDPYDDNVPTTRTPFTLNANYIVIDGQVGRGNGSVEQHGFKFYNAIGATTGTWQSSFLIGSIIGAPSTSHHISIKHCEIAKPGCDNSRWRGRGLYVSSMMESLTYLLLHSCHIHDIPGISIYFNNTRNSTVEYCHVARNHSDAVSHGEGIQTGGNCSYNVVRYSIWEDIEGTAIIVGDTGWEVYGNLAYYTPAYVNSNPLGRHAPGVLCSNFVGMGFFTTTGGGSRAYCKIYNNTISGNNLTAADGGTLGIYLTGVGNIAYNNIFANCRRLRITIPDADYNLLYNNASDDSYTEAHIQRPAANPFVDAASHNYHLAADTNAGLLLDDIFSYDMEGNKRGSTGNWSRGAFQY